MTVTTRALIEREVFEIAATEDQDVPATRHDVARKVALVVARFVGNGRMADRIMMEPLDVETLERFVVEHADEARSVNLHGYSFALTGLVGPVLDDLGLYQDFNRIVRGDQWMAFDGSEG